LLAPAAQAQEATLPDIVVELLDLPRLPAPAADPSGRYLLLVHQHSYLPLELLSAPTLTVAGRRLDPATFAPHAPIPYFGLTLIDHETGDQTKIALPDDVTIGYPLWSPDGSRFAFTVTTSTGVELWLGNPATAEAQRLTAARLNAARGAPCAWMPNNRELLCRVQPAYRAPLSTMTVAEAVSPITLAGMPSRLDHELVPHFLYSQLEFVNIATGERQRFRRPMILESITPSPDGKLFLATLGLPHYSYLGSLESWSERIEVWDREGRLLRTLTSNSETTPDAPKAVRWQPTHPQTLVWVEHQGGEEQVLAQSAPFTAPPTVVYSSPHRFAGIEWLDESNRALVSEYDTDHRIRRTWLVDSGNPEAPPRRLGSGSVDAAFPALGTPLTRRNRTGESVVRIRHNAIWLVGQTNTGGYIERLNLDSMRRERIWESDGEGYERVVDLLTFDGNLLLTQRETADEPPNYRLYDLTTGAMRAITDQAHPAPELARVKRVPLRYRRADGVALSATLYVPPDVEALGDMPLLVWAYPRRYGLDSSPVTPDRPARFPDPEEAFKLSFALSGYAVLDDVSMPVVGNADDANDAFLEQIIANAEAAVAAAARTGYADPERVGIAGHSYGAFMVANLLAHTDLFAAGIAMSGSYNRTLTPFGFQTERRSLWQARDTYLKMSPLLYSDQIGSPLLLVHGALDDNPGTAPTQSQQLYDAIRHNGGEAQLLLLPYEGHSYRARASVHLTARAMLGWLEDHLRPQGPATGFATAAVKKPPLGF
jgi:dipeptidyl aminopeptidase/acylaminoacyl peptidase